MRHLKPNAFKVFRIALLACSIIVLNLTIVATPLLEKLSAAPANSISGINLPRNQEYDEGAAVDLQTCRAYFSDTYLSRGLFEDSLGRNFNDDVGSIGEVYGSFPSSIVGLDGPVIRFKAAPQNQSKIVNGVYNGSSNSSTCNNTILVPTGLKTYAGLMFSGGGVAVNYPTIKAVVNSSEPDGGPNTYITIEYWDATKEQPCNNGLGTGGSRLDRDCVASASNFGVEGKPSSLNSGRTPSVTLDLNARWVDASTIERSINSSVKETYRLNRWSSSPTTVCENSSCSESRNVSWTVYLLDDSDMESRNSQNQNSGRSCTNPIERIDNNYHPYFTCSPPAGGQQCTPFIVVTEQLNISSNNGRPNIDGPSENFSQRVGKMGSANAYLYDFDSECVYRGHSQGQTLGRAERARAWFYYSAEAEAVVNVFPQGEGNESPFIGTYGEIDSNENGVKLFQGGRSGCNARARVVQDSGSDLLATTWQFWDEPSCSALGSNIGTVQVITIGGQAGEDGFEAISGRTGAIEVPESETLQELSCVENSALDWILCPVLNLAIAGSEGLDMIINTILDVDTNQIFGNEKTSEAYHTAWAVFRTFALVLIAAAALIMVIAQAAGLEILDAYTIRKVLPRLILASIGITLSWELMEFLITLSNDLGSGIRSIIYAPFSGESGFNFSVGLAGFLGGLALVGGVTVLGMVAFPVVLSLLLSGLLAGLIAVGLLVFREVLIIFLVIVAPIAIACSILPNTEKAWSLWKGTFFSMLAVFFIISALIAMGRVLAVTSAGAGIFLTDIIAIIAWFAPYFLIPFAFRLAGGVVSRLTGVLNDRSKGMFDRLRKQRQQSVANRFQALKEGRAGNYNPLARGVGGLIRRATPGSGGFVPTAGGQARYEAAQQSMFIQAAEQSLKNDDGRAAYDDDANYIASQSKSKRDFINRYTSQVKHADGTSATEAEAMKSLGLLEQGYGVDVGTKQSRLAAAMALSRSPTSFKKFDANGDYVAMTTEEMLQKTADINAGLINDGLMNQDDAAAMWKKNSARPDIGKISHGTWRTLAQTAADTKKANPNASGAGLITPKLVKDAKKNIIENIDPSFIGARPEAAENWSRLMQERIATNQKAMSTASSNNDAAGYQQAETDYIQDLARIKSVHESFSRANSSNTQYVAGLFDSPGAMPGSRTLFDDMESRTTKEDPRFQKLRHEWSVRDAATGRNQPTEES
jgi:hypothetical protein